MSTSYTAKDITVLDGIEGIRQRPGMYIGGTDEDAVKHCVLEIISNSVDEALNGYGNIIVIKMLLHSIIFHLILNTGKFMGF